MQACFGGVQGLLQAAPRGTPPRGPMPSVASHIHRTRLIPGPRDGCLCRRYLCHSMALHQSLEESKEAVELLILVQYSTMQHHGGVQLPAAATWPRAALIVGSSMPFIASLALPCLPQTRLTPHDECPHRCHARHSLGPSLKGPGGHRAACVGI
jgi:hypothetical protein